MNYQAMTLKEARAEAQQRWGRSGYAFMFRVSDSSTVCPILCVLTIGKFIAGMGPNWLHAFVDAAVRVEPRIDKRADAKERIDIEREQAQEYKLVVWSQADATLAKEQRDVELGLTGGGK